MSRLDRRAAERGGRIAETKCAVWLMLHGWRIVARRSKHPVGEVDLVARRGRVLAFIEVKARGSVSAAAESILPRQQERIARAAAAFLQTRPHLAALDPRFDVMLGASRRLLVHIPNAWHILR
ncbi:MAG: YraN family protein [Alphaproteobacteria bacterium]|nr:YraN family protein [Alphaproteobacteria bacterium]